MSDVVVKNIYNANSSRPNSSIYCFIVSVDCHFLLDVLDWSIAGLRIVSKSPYMICKIIEECEESVNGGWGGC